MPARGSLVGALIALSLAPVAAWNNGRTGNTGTDTKAECSDPRYATHDWIADHALALLPEKNGRYIILDEEGFIRSFGLIGD